MKSYMIKEGDCKNSDKYAETAGEIPNENTSTCEDNTRFMIMSDVTSEAMNVNDTGNNTKET